MGQGDQICLELHCSLGQAFGQFPCLVGTHVAAVDFQADASCGEKQDACLVLHGIEDTKEVSAIVCDKDTGMAKCWFAVDDALHAVFPSIVWRPTVKVGMDQQDSCERRGS